MSVDERIIDQVSAATDIVTVISEYIPLKRAGNNFKAPCPFHQEKTPSFMVSQHKQIYHCFGCGAGGNVFSFIMKYQNMTFPDALRFLADRVGITIPERSSQSKEAVSRARMLLDIYQAASEFYHEQYHAARGTSARTYIEVKRKFTPEIANIFLVGYAPQEWHSLWEHLKNKGFDQDAVLASGLVVRSDKGTPYDFFRNRVIFPIVNLKDRVVGFGGRTMGNDEPKYINTPETEIFRKRYELYGLASARREIAQNGNTVIVVEGYLDVISLYQAGVRNAVAPLGTALTLEHVRLLKRYADKAILVFDGDRAGINAAVRSIDIFLQEGLCAEVVTLPDGHDPDSLLRERGSLEFVRALDAVQDVFQFKLEAVLRQHNARDARGLIAITKEMIETLRLVESAVLRDKYVRLLAERLNIREASVWKELERVHAVPDAREGSTDDVQKQSLKRPLYEEELIALYIMITDPSARQTALACLSETDFERPDAREIFRALHALHSEGAVIDCSVIMNRMTSEEAQSTVSLMPFIPFGEESADEVLHQRIREIKLKQYDRKLQEVHQEIVAAEAQRDEEKRIQCQAKKIALQREKQKLTMNKLMV